MRRLPTSEGSNLKAGLPEALVPSELYRREALAKCSGFQVAEEAEGGRIS